MRNRVAKSILSVAKIEEGYSQLEQGDNSNTNNDDKRTITREITKGILGRGQKSKRIWDELSKKIGITSNEDWFVSFFFRYSDQYPTKTTKKKRYSIQNKTIQQNGGTSLLLLYQKSLFSVLRNLYPDYNWLPWKFEHLPRR